MTSLERPQDEMANVITHGIGLLLSVAAACCLMERVQHQANAKVIACGIYSITLVLVFGTSTLSHLFHDLRWRRRFRTLDQACIFLLIAGTYTPVAVAYVYRGWWPLVLVCIWCLALIGVLRVTQVRDLSRKDKILFGLMGFLPAVTLGELFRFAPTEVIVGVIMGGACYSFGAIFLRISTTVRYAHAIWHLFVVLGAAFHFWAILAAMSDRHTSY